MIANLRTIDFIGPGATCTAGRQCAAVMQECPICLLRYNLFEVTHTAQIGTAAGAVVVTTQQLLPDAG